MKNKKEKELDHCYYSHHPLNTLAKCNLIIASYPPSLTHKHKNTKIKKNKELQRSPIVVNSLQDEVKAYAASSSGILQCDSKP